MENENDLYIEWFPGWKCRSKGNMTIHMDKFLPCEMQRFKKLLKIIELDERQDEIKEKLKSYLQKRIDALPDEEGARKLKAQADEHRRLASQAKREINAIKRKAEKEGRLAEIPIRLEVEYDNNMYEMRHYETKAKHLLDPKFKAKFEKFISLL